jgi:cell division protein FtsL
MNAASRLVHHNVLTRHLVLTHLLTRQQIVILMLSLAVLLSALGIIYVTHMTRMMHASLQHNVIEKGHLHVEKGQLLLERSTLMRPARIQLLAEKKLDMIVPEQKSVVIVREER